MVEHTPALDGIDSKTIVVVALSAFGTAAASVRALDGMAEKVVLGGQRKYIEIGLRPPFFREGDLVGRLETLMHELLHLDPNTPGALRDDYRHDERTQAEVDAEARTLVDTLLQTIDPVLVAPLGHDGEVLMRHWARRPVGHTASRSFDDKDVYLAPVRMLTPKGARSTWW